MQHPGVEWQYQPVACLNEVAVPDGERGHEEAAGAVHRVGYVTYNNEARAKIR